MNKIYIFNILLDYIFIMIIYLLFTLQVYYYIIIYNILYIYQQNSISFFDYKLFSPVFEYVISCICLNLILVIALNTIRELLSIEYGRIEFSLEETALVK